MVAASEDGPPGQGNAVLEISRLHAWVSLQTTVFHGRLLERMAVLSEPEEPLPFPLVGIGEGLEAQFDLRIRATVIQEHGGVEDLIGGVTVVRVAVVHASR